MLKLQEVYYLHRLFSENWHISSKPTQSKAVSKRFQEKQDLDIIEHIVNLKWKWARHIARQSHETWTAKALGG